MGKYKSRAVRLSEAVKGVEGKDLNEATEELEEVLIDFENKKKSEKITKLIEMIGELGIDITEIESLKGEMESWASNMEGTNLENTEKYERVSEARDELENVLSVAEEISSGIDELKGLSERYMENENLKNLREMIEKAREVDDSINELDVSSVEFPGMY